MHRNYVGAVERAEVNATLAVIVRILAGLDMSPGQVLKVLEYHLQEQGRLAAARNVGQPNSLG